MREREPAMRIERVDASVIIDLRWRVLRAGMPRESAVFDHDDAPTSAHFAARDAAGAVVGCVSLHRRPFPDTPPLGAGYGETLRAAGVLDSPPVWQLRGMAVDASARGTGVGAALLHAVEGHAAAAAARNGAPPAMWCNARKPAVPFYTRHGWVVVSDEFDVPTAGPHRRMLRTLRP